jgi:4-diphosphocytidyl-2-C-methyl-D-erythritol kinase
MAPESRTLTGLAPAKLNLGLAITGRREDGYHELRSVFLRIGLWDRLQAAILPGAAADRLTVVGDSDCPVEGNIVLRAVEMLRQAVGTSLPTFELHLEKAVPIGAGLGGGSSDAAAALDLCVALSGIEPGLIPMERIRRELGADVSFFAAGTPAALVSGIGERVRSLPGVRGDAGVLLASPASKLATADVYAEYDRLGPQAAPGDAEAVVDELAGALEEGLDGAGIASFAHRLRDANDLWPAAASLAPELADLRADLERSLDRPVLLSGSGSSLFGLYASAQDAVDAGAQLASNHPGRFGALRLTALGVSIDHPPRRFS